MPFSTLQINVVKTYSLFVSTTLYQWGKTTKGMGIGGPVTLNRYREGHELPWDKGASYECEFVNDEEADPDTSNYNSKDGAWRNNPYY